ncbi:hypothetical protein [Enterococcus mediterraneensis]|uniref:hypothetical protein n=1 Tax=Enterococcus mediterraneensis TaxID=2364791 RepID=UPI000F048BAF|nr:hypothetical protein [Enterococcus mediterraneensis]
MPKMDKQDFMKKYKYSDSTYKRRMAVLKSTEHFSRAYQRVTAKEVRIDTDLYDQFLAYLALNRLRTRKVSVPDFLEKAGKTI